MPRPIGTTPSASPARPKPRSPIVLPAAATAFLLSCAIARGGFFSSADPGDVGRYRDFANLMGDGKIPCRDFYFEYPPGAIAPFLAPLALDGVIDYNLAFKILGGSLWTRPPRCGREHPECPECRSASGRCCARHLRAHARLARCGRAQPLRHVPDPARRTCSPRVALLAPSDRVCAARRGLRREVFPAVVLPVAAIHVWRTRGRDELVCVGAVFVGVSSLLFVRSSPSRPAAFDTASTHSSSGSCNSRATERRCYWVRTAPRMTSALRAPWWWAVGGCIAVRLAILSPHSRPKGRPSRLPGVSVRATVR